MSLDKLVYMANQIGKFFASQGTEKAAAGTADHIKKFWDPRMRAPIFAHLEAGGAGLDPRGSGSDREVSPESTVGSNEGKTSKTP